MMFLQFFIWGAWFVTAYPVLSKFGFGADQIKWTFSAGPIAAIVSPFAVGFLADRWASSQRLLSALHAIAGLCMITAIYTITRPESNSTLANTFIFLHTLFYMPTIALTAAITLRHVRNRIQDFPRIRFFGGVGWIAAAGLISWFGIDTSIKSFYLSVVASAVLVVFALFLPDTPPPQEESKSENRRSVWSDVRELFSNKNFSVFVFGMFLLFIPVSFYFQLGARYIEWSGFQGIAAIMSLGQVTELIFILALPFLIRRYSIRTVILTGCLAWIIRYGLFAGSFTYSLPYLAVAAVLLHGICYDFCFIAGTVHVDQMASDRNRSQAQSIFMICTFGFGLRLGAQLAGLVESSFTTSSVPGLAEINWTAIWLVPAGIAAAVLALLAVFFRSGGEIEKSGLKRYGNETRHG